MKFYFYQFGRYSIIHIFYVCVSISFIIPFLIFRLDQSQLFTLYSQFGLNYQTIFQNIAVDILTEETTKYTAYEFFWDRGRIKDDFQRVNN
jgi:hypothetical protein